MTKLKNSQGISKNKKKLQEVGIPFFEMCYVILFSCLFPRDTLQVLAG
jgi:hypothetical protein